MNVKCILWAMVLLLGRVGIARADACVPDLVWKAGGSPTIHVTPPAGTDIKQEPIAPAFFGAALEKNGDIVFKDAKGLVERVRKSDKGDVVQQVTAPDWLAKACATGIGFKVPTRTFTVPKGKASASNAPPILDLAAIADDAGARATRTKGKLTPDDLNRGKASFIVGILADDKLARVKLEEEPSNTPGTGPAPSAPDDRFCKDMRGFELVCVDMSKQQRRLLRVPKRNVMAPNIGLAVRVRHEVGADVRIQWGGTRGLTPPSVLTPEGIAHSGAVGEEGVIEDVLTFSPRQPGAADLSIELTKGDEKRTLTIELEVEKLAWGAVRFGFGAIFGDAAGKKYEARAMPGSVQPEIVLASDRKPNYEIALGFAPYIVDVLACGGRSHTRGCNFFLAPYIGFGVVGERGATIDALTSFYLGGEVEFAPSFSLAGVAVWRRIDALLPGLAQGSPVDASSAFTSTATGFGWALILNTSPDFLQFGSPSSGKTDSATTSSATGATSKTSTPKDKEEEK